MKIQHLKYPQEQAKKEAEELAREEKINKKLEKDLQKMYNNAIFDQFERDMINSKTKTEEDIDKVLEKWSQVLEGFTLSKKERKEILKNNNR